MNVALYQSSAAMSANMAWHDLISQNLSGQAAPGYQVQLGTFEEFRVPGMDPEASQMGSAYPMLRTSTIHTQGELKPTGSKTDLALDGPGFFAVRLDNGTTAYTRDGELRVDAAGRLKTKDGGLVLGEGGPITLDPVAGPMSVNPLGEISQAGVVRGRIRAVEFPNPASLQHLAGSYYVPAPPTPGMTAAAAAASQGVPARNTSLQQGFLEVANSNPVLEMGNLLLAMRHFEANQRALQFADERMGKTIQELGAPPQ